MLLNRIYPETDPYLWYNKNGFRTRTAPSIITQEKLSNIDFWICYIQCWNHCWFLKSYSPSSERFIHELHSILLYITFILAIVWCSPFWWFTIMVILAILLALSNMIVSRLINHTFFSKSDLFESSSFIF